MRRAPPTRAEADRLAMSAALDEARDEIVTLEHRLRAAHRMEAVGRLAGGVAHDFNNLLTAIVSHVSLARQRLDEDHPAWSDLEGVHAASLRASELVRRLLAFSNQQTVEPRVVDLGDVVSGLAKLLARLIGEDVDLRTTVCDVPPRVLVDPSQLEQVLVNLAVNARDAMPDGGDLTVEVTRREDDGGRWAVVHVRDTGAGVPEEARDRIFEPFFTTKTHGRGTGLGLATSLDIVRTAGGRIEVESTAGAGSTFSVVLPETAAHVCRAPRPAEPEPVPRGGGERILLVEDEPLVRAAASRLLRRLGYAVVEASDGEVARRLSLDPGAAAPDLLITDVVMPRIGGVELARELTARLPSLRVLFISGYGERDAVDRARALPGVSFLGKPFVFEHLARTVRDVLDR